MAQFYWITTNFGITSGVASSVIRLPIILHKSVDNAVCIFFMGGMLLSVSMGVCASSGMCGAVEQDFKTSRRHCLFLTTWHVLAAK
jgi:hypothetical protein